MRAFVIILALLAGCATYSQVLIGPEGDIMTCSATGAGGLGLAAANSARNSCVKDLEMVGYRKIEEVGIIGIRFGEGVIIEYVWPDSPAESAGLMTGDTIIAIDGKATETGAEIWAGLRAGPMVYVNLIIERDSESLDFKIRRIAYTKLFGTPGK